MLQMTIKIEIIKSKYFKYALKTTKYQNINDQNVKRNKRKAIQIKKTKENDKKKKQ